MDTTKTVTGQVDGFQGDAIRIITFDNQVIWVSARKSPACRRGDGVKLNKFSDGDWAIVEVGDIRMVQS